MQYLLSPEEYEALRQDKKSFDEKVSATVDSRCSDILTKFWSNLNSSTFRAACPDEYAQRELLKILQAAYHKARE